MRDDVGAFMSMVTRSARCFRKHASVLMHPQACAATPKKGSLKGASVEHGLGQHTEEESMLTICCHNLWRAETHPSSCALTWIIKCMLLFQDIARSKVLSGNAD